MQYISTRGQCPPASFCDTLLQGLAPDGGLYLPQFFPDLSAKLPLMNLMSYAEIATEVIHPFCSEEFSREEVAEICEAAYASFDHNEVTPLSKLGRHQLLELYHGPTLAFKDVALQLLGQLFQRVLKKRNQQLNIVAATSGDTGSAAIEGLYRIPGVRLFVMHPKGKIAPLQELQMTSVISDNVFNIAVDGSFDDCQQLMKDCLGDNDYRQQWHLGAVNSVNWARLLAQSVYYFYSWSRSDMPARGMRYAVPSGNFGDIFAGFCAAKMGLPIEELRICTNENDILHRFFESGSYRRGQVHHTLSPAMDIQLASNFERYLYYYLDEDAEELSQHLEKIKKENGFELAEGKPKTRIFSSARASDEQIKAALIDCKQKTKRTLDPHTATAWHGVKDDLQSFTLLATAHPAKFPAALKDALAEEVTHPTLDALKGKEQRLYELPATSTALRAFIEEHC